MADLLFFYLFIFLQKYSTQLAAVIDITSEGRSYISKCISLKGNG